MSAPTTSAPLPLFSLLRQIPGNLFRLDEKPLLGFPPPFPWNTLTSQLAQSLQIEGLTIQQGEWQWRAKEDLFTGLSQQPRGFALTLVPLSGPLWWAMPEKEVATLMGLLLAKESAFPSDGTHTEFFQAFYRFLAVEAINAYEKATPDKQLSVTLSSEEKLANEACLCLDITITLASNTFHGRLFLSSEFRKSWSQRYLQQQTSLDLSSPIADSLDVIVHLEAGRVHLKRSEWKSINVGDFLILETCSVDPDESKGRVMLVINEMPLFRGRIKQGNLKILEHPLEHEVDTLMDEDNQPPKETDEEFDDLDHLDDDELEKETESSESHESSDDDDFDIDDLDLEEHEEKPAKKASPPAAAPAQKAPAAAPLPTTKAPEGIIAVPGSSINTIDEIPLPIVIEVGRIQMSIKKLLELQPGNMLELDIHPESNVDLVIHGKRIARGELLRIGDALGVRILELS